MGRGPLEGGGLVGEGSEPDRTPRDDDQQALEEIRRLFARYRQGARHGVVSERDEAEEREEAPALTGR
jgi:hypothetical protein